MGYNNSEDKQVNRFVYYARKVYHPLGFHKGYNFPLFVITCGALMGFALSRFSYLNIDGVYMKNAQPGEQYWYRSGLRRVGIIMHLAAILPACFLVVFQFVPIIRYKFIIVHRLNGYLCILLLLVANVGALIVAKHAVGGSASTQVWVGALATMVTVALILAYANIKLLQIDQHRAWMLRAWGWAANIISLRLVQLAANKVIQDSYVFYNPIPCPEIRYLYEFYAGIPSASPQNPAGLIYSQCRDPLSTAVVAVRSAGPGFAGPENLASLLATTFILSGWVATIIHVILVELYLALTPAESARLRQVSYERQVKAGFKRPNLGGLTSTRFGDAPEGWNSPIVPEAKRLSGDTTADSSDPEVDQLHTAPKVDASMGPLTV